MQAEEMQMSGMVDSLGRKNRYLLKELEEAQRSNEELYVQLIKANSERVCREKERGLRAIICTAYPKWWPLQSNLQTSVTYWKRGISHKHVRYLSYFTSIGWVLALWSVTRIWFHHPGCAVYVCGPDGGSAQDNEHGKADGKGRVLLVHQLPPCFLISQNQENFKAAAKLLIFRLLSHRQESACNTHLPSNVLFNYHHDPWSMFGKKYRGKQRKPCSGWRRRWQAWERNCMSGSVRSLSCTWHTR